MTVERVGNTMHSQALRQIDALCDRFATAWKAGAPLAIEDLLAEVDAETRLALLEELLTLDVAYRRRNGLPVAVAEYQARFAEAEPVLQRLFAANLAQTDVRPAETAAGFDVTSAARFVNLHFFKAGGLGELYRAQDQTLARDVALKFIRPTLSNNLDYLERFQIEAKVTGRLDHPGVVPVYGLGETCDGRRFYAMRFVDGCELQDEIELYHRTGCRRIDLYRLVGHLIAVCQTVAYAHSRGVIHRDIKPANIKIGKFGETILLDWGLAQSIERDDAARARGWPSLVQEELKAKANSDGGAGTIGFMSPEQTGDPPAEPAAATDIYSLGATLYYLLTNSPAIYGPNNSATRERIRRGDFPPPSAQEPNVPRALEAICLKAMATAAKDRYPRALDLADDLRAWLADESVSVYREPLSERAVRWVRRHRAGAVSLAAVAATLLIGSLWLASYSNERATVEQKARLRAEAAELDGMRVAARLAAGAVASDVNLRWQILESAAEDPRLAEYMAALGSKAKDSPEQAALQTWLEEARKRSPVEVKSMTVMDATGKQLARVPLDPKTLFNNYARRDYFHGQGLTANVDEATLTPHRLLHRSAAFKSTADAKLTVAFSVPIWKSADRRSDPIGILSMTVMAGNYAALLTGMNTGQVAALIDLHPDAVGDGEGNKASAQNGLVLHHPDLWDVVLERASRNEAAVFRVDKPIVEALQSGSAAQLERHKLLQDEAAHGKTIPPPMNNILGDYRDPLHPQSPPVRAAYEPVIVRNRGVDSCDVGWVVIVHERESRRAE